jgi:hypothetical protein
MRVVDVELSQSLEMVEASPGDDAGDPTTLSRRIRIVPEPDASVQTTVDAQPSVLGHFRLEKVNLRRESLLQTEDFGV